MPTSRSITRTARISALVEFSHVYGRMFENGLDGRLEGELKVDWVTVVDDTPVLVRLDAMAVE
jgi:hypothetical protein